MAEEPSHVPSIQDHNGWADFWRNKIGVNVIPADTSSKVPSERWLELQDKPIPEELHNKWKANGAFSKGMAVILGKVWHNEQKLGLYLNGIDADNLKAVEEICRYKDKRISIEELAKWTLVEQHQDDPNRLHLYVYSHKPFVKKSSDRKNNLIALSLKNNEIPAIEVKGLGSHGILFCSPSFHKNGHRIQIIGVCEPVIADDFEKHIDQICRNYGLQYLEIAKDGNACMTMQDIYDDNTKVQAGNNRHEAILRFIESQIARNRTLLDSDIIFSFCKEKNQGLGNPPLSDKEFESQWDDGVDFIAKQESIDVSQLFNRRSDDPENIIPSLIIRNTKVLSEDGIKRLAEQQFKRLTCDMDFKTAYENAIKIVDNRREKYEAQGESKSKTEAKSDNLYHKILQKERKPPADILYKIASEKISQKFRDSETSEPYAVCITEKGKTLYDMESEQFRYYLRTKYEEHHNFQQKEFFEPYTNIDLIEDKNKRKHEKEEFFSSCIEKGIKIYPHEKVIGKDNLNRTIEQLISGITEKKVLYSRLGWLKKENVIYYNLNNLEGQIIKISADPNGKGWEIIDGNDLVMFRKREDNHEQVIPSKDYDPNKRYLRELLSGFRFKHEHQIKLQEVYILSLLLNGISHPVHVPFGSEGSGKSLLQYTSKSLIDPYESQSLGTLSDRMAMSFEDLDIDERRSWDRALTIEQNYITYFDNVSGVTKQIMDELCRWCSPGYHKSKEKKYANKEKIEISGKRPVGLNGISNPVTAPDLLSRVFSPNLLEIPDGEKEEIELMLESFWADKPMLLGYCLGIMSKFLASYKQLRKEIKPRQRLTDFEVAGEIISRCLGNEDGEFQYLWNTKNKEDQTETAIETSTLAKTLIVYVHMQNKKEIQKEPENLFTELKRCAERQGTELKDDKTFPKISNWLTPNLDRLQVALRGKGIEVITGEHNSQGRRIIRIINHTLRPSLA